MTGTQHIANDNERPAFVRRVGQSSQKKTRLSPVRKPIPTPTFGKSTNIKSTNTGVKTEAPPQENNRLLGLVALALWMGSIAAMIFAYQNAATPLQTLSASMGFGWASLILLHVSKRQGRDFFRKLAMLGTLLSLLITALTLYLGFNIQLNTGLTLCMGAALALALGALTQEKFPVLVSVILSAMWVGNAHFAPESSQLAWLFPTFFVLQYWLGSKMHSPTALFLSCLTIIAWLYSNLFHIAQNGTLPTVLVLGMLLMSGLAYNRLGKLLQDRNKPTGLLHTSIAWAVTFCAALGLQHVWGASAETVQSSNLFANDTVTIIGVTISMVLSLLIIGTSIVRMRSGHQSNSETLVITGIALALIIFINSPDKFSNLALPLIPEPQTTLAYVIGGIIAAAAIALIVNGARRGKGFMIMLGIVALISELYLAIPNLIAKPEYVYAFGYSGLFSLLFLSLFAQKNMSARSERYMRYA